VTAPRPAKQVAKALRTKGMIFSKTHHQMFAKKVNGILVKTRISNGTSQLTGWHVEQMAKQCGLHVAEFLELVDCTLSEDGWNVLVQQRFVNGKDARNWK